MMKLTREEFTELYKSYGFQYISGYNENMTREEAIRFLETMSGKFEAIYNDDKGEEDDI